MTIRNDITGKRFGRLVAIQPIGRRKNGNSIWEFVCDCGNKTNQTLGNLFPKGKVQSCGCLARELTIERSTIHGMTKSPEYNCWRRMWYRCYDTKRKNFFQYGGRGIVMCERWRVGENGLNGFQCFFHDMGNRPEEGLTIDRIDPNGNYEKSNCRWADKDTQHNNKRTTHFLETRGKKMSVSQWSRESGVSVTTILDRKKRGLSDEEAIFTPTRNEAIA